MIKINRESIDKIIDKMADIVFPKRCPMCDEIINNIDAGSLICGKCKSSVPIINEPRCKKCSKSLKDERIEYCYDCSKGKHIYKSGIALVEHEGAVRKSLYSVKYNNKREYLEYYIGEIARLHGELIRDWNADVLIPVPMYKRKQIKRGFNQATEAARLLGRTLKIPVDEKTLIRKINTKPQKELSDKERHENVENAFHINENIVEYSKVILVDDIYTTGSTIDSCARVLIDKGVDEVYFISVSIGDGL